MAASLISLRLTLLRRSARGVQGAWTWIGSVLGTLLAVATLALGLLPAPQSVRGDLLALGSLAWLLGWAVWPAVGGPDPLPPRSLALTPRPPAVLALHLAWSKLVSVAPAFTALALGATVLLGWRSGVAPGLLSLVAWPLQALLTLLIANVLALLLGRALHSRVGAVLGALVWGLLLACAAQGWAVIAALNHSGVVQHGLAPQVAAVLRWLPSGWGAALVEAASAGRWFTALLILLAFLMTCGVLLLTWQRQLVRELRRDGHASPAVHGRPALLERLGPVLGRELLGWARRPTRLYILAFALGYALSVAGLPLLVGATAVLPWTGVVFTLMAAALSTNLYGRDGTALWLTVSRPGSSGPDVRGRQWGWLLPVGALATCLSGAGLALGGGQAWTFVAVALPAVLGGGAGVVALLSVLAPLGQLDPGRGRAPTSGGAASRTPLLFLTLGAVALTALPGELVGRAGGVAPGVLTSLALGAALCWGLGRLAARRLERRGAHLVQHFRTGHTPETPKKAPNARPRADHRVFLLLWLGTLALVPQGLVPLAFQAHGAAPRGWFLALYLPAPWGQCVALAMTAAGLAACTVGVRRWLSGAAR